ncbi:hypothetical protein G6011_06973 [Alternaria panax]|uniref:DUF6594 domain-containing protein n=1 Tax=Alternaria panax TaxID=48097 RepID=A0AAD4F9G9_9PLEO|nr:hypothetical protein G6011_06973 [Alternaria panax]
MDPFFKSDLMNTSTAPSRRVFRTFGKDDTKTVEQPDVSWDYNKKLPADYPQLTGFMTRRPERALFRTFRTLSVQNLLYMQAEIDHLGWNLRRTMDEEQELGTTAEYATDWGWYTQASSASACEISYQYHVIMKKRLFYDITNLTGSQLLIVSIPE